MRRRSCTGGKKLKLFTKRFFPAGNYTWVVPSGCVAIDVFLVGGGGSGSDGGAGGGGYTKTILSIPVSPGQPYPIIVGYGGGGQYQGIPGGPSKFGAHEALGGNNGIRTWEPFTQNGGDGGSGGGGGGGYGGISGTGGSDGSSGTEGYISTYRETYYGGQGQGTNTRDFGEATGKRNAGGGHGGISDYIEGSGSKYGGGGYGGGGGASWASTSSGGSPGAGGDGTVLLRYWAFEE